MLSRVRTSFVFIPGIVVATCVAFRFGFAATFPLVLAMLVIGVADVCATHRWGTRFWYASLALPILGWILTPLPIFIVILAWMGHGADAGPDADRWIAVYGTAYSLSLIFHLLCLLMPYRLLTFFFGSLSVTGYVVWLSATRTVGMNAYGLREFWLPSLLASGCVGYLWMTFVRPGNQPLANPE